MAPAQLSTVLCLAVHYTEDQQINLAGYLGSFAIIIRAAQVCGTSTVLINVACKNIQLRQVHLFAL